MLLMKLLDMKDHNVRQFPHVKKCAYLAPKESPIYSINGGKQKLRVAPQKNKPKNMTKNCIKKKELKMSIENHPNLHAVKLTTVIIEGYYKSLRGKANMRNAPDISKLVREFVARILMEVDTAVGKEPHF